MKSVLLFLASALAAVAMPVAASTVWFEVSPVDAGGAQSFLLPISQPDFIEEARAMLAQPKPDRPSVVAQIRAGGDGLNRNLRSPEKHLWSWHVGQLLTFSNVAIAYCDGSPHLVEQDPQAFIDHTGGQICFWGYSIDAEIPPPKMTPTDELNGFWYAPGSAGTGFAVDVYEDLSKISLAWLRYAPTAAAYPEQQWMFGVGDIGDAAIGGYAQIALLVPVLPATPEGEEISLDVLLRFEDCNHAELIVMGELPTSLPLLRVVPQYNCGQ